jgi:Icc-related predicted phosphoesterase
MKFKLLNDLHLEFEALEIPVCKDEAETTLILAGDIHVGIGAYDFINEMCGRFLNVILVAGNHEYYNNNIFAVADAWNNYAKGWHNFYFLDNDTVDLTWGFETVTVIGGTLWTDCGTQHPDAWFIKQQLENGMNDFTCITTQDDMTGEVRTFKVHDAVYEHDKTVDFIRAALEECETTQPDAVIVVTHHLPTFDIMAEKWKTAPHTKMNHGFATNLNGLIYKYKPTVWCCGHTHDTINKVVDETQFYCNPRGYAPFAINPEFDVNFTFEVQG